MGPSLEVELTLICRLVGLGSAFALRLDRALSDGGPLAAIL
jgi:hypothetical protein